MYIPEILDYNTKNKYYSCLYILQNPDYNTKNKYPNLLYIPEIRDYNTKNKYPNYLYIPEDLHYNTTLYDVLTCTHMRDKFNVNNNYILTSYIGSGLVDYNTAHNILIISLYTISIIHTRASTSIFQHLIL